MPKVSMVKVAGRDRDQVLAGVRRAVELAGGLADRIRPGMLVMVKPNLVAPPPSAEAGACTSAPVCQAVADLAAVDAVAGRIMGFEAEEVPVTRGAALRDLGTLDEQAIQVVGERLASVRRRAGRWGKRLTPENRPG